MMFCAAGSSLAGLCLPPGNQALTFCFAEKVWVEGRISTRPSRVRLGVFCARTTLLPSAGARDLSPERRRFGARAAAMSWLAALKIAPTWARMLLEGRLLFPPRGADARPAACSRFAWTVPSCQLRKRLCLERRPTVLSALH